jgi:poly(beta-D-mannuronate) lyase
MIFPRTYQVISYLGTIQDTLYDHIYNNKMNFNRIECCYRIVDAWVVDMKVKVIVLGAFGAVLALSHFNAAMAASATGSCPSYPPVQTVVGAVMYSDEAGSVKSSSGEAKNNALLAPIDDFLTYLGHAADEKTDTANLACPLLLLQQWAEAGALLTPPETPGRVSRVWITPAFDFIALKFRMRGVAIGTDTTRWLSQLAAAERQDYSKPFQKPPYVGLYSNVYPWVGAANALSALISGDQEAMRFQDEAWNNMIAEIRPDGTLQGEMGRAAQALEYHLKAVAGLLILHSVRHALGQTDDPAHIKKLKLLLTMTGNALCDPALLATKVGTTLNPPGVWDFRIPYAFDDGLLPESWNTCGPKTMNWFQSEYSGGDSRISAQAVKAASHGQD